MMKRGNIYVVVMRGGVVFDAEYQGALHTGGGKVHRFSEVPFCRASKLYREWVDDAEIVQSFDLGAPLCQMDFEEALRKVLT